MTYGVYPQPIPPPKPPVSTADAVVSSILLALTVLGGAVAGFMGVFMMAFTDTCPPQTCDIEAGVTALMTAFGIAVLAAVGGITVTIIALVRRLRAWPFAVATAVVCAGSCVAGLAGYISAVGG